MNGKERFQSLLSGVLPDRVPVLCNLFEQGAKEMGLSIKDYYSRGENVAEGQLRLQTRFGYDQLWGYHYAAGEAEILGAEHTLFAQDGPPNVGQLIIKNERDIDALSVEDSVFESSHFTKIIKTIEILKRERGSQCPVLSSVVGSVSLPPLLMGMENWLDLLYTGSQKRVEQLLEKCTRFCHRKMELLYDAGVDIITYFNPLGSAYFVTSDQFTRNILPWIKNDIEGMEMKKLVYFNGGGCINPFIQILMENTPLRAFCINPFDSIDEAKKIIKEQGLLLGTINDIPLISQTPEEIRNEVKRIMDEGARGGGFVFGTLVMPLAIEDYKIEVMMEAAREYGQYES